MESENDESGLGSGAGHGLGNDGGSDQLCELVLGRGSVSSAENTQMNNCLGVRVWRGQAWKQTDIFSVQHDSPNRSCKHKTSMSYGRERDDSVWWPGQPSPLSR